MFEPRSLDLGEQVGGAARRSRTPNAPAHAPCAIGHIGRTGSPFLSDSDDCGEMTYFPDDMIFRGGISDYASSAHSPVHYFVDVFLPL